MSRISFQTKIARKLRPLRKKLMDNNLEHLGMDMELFVMTIDNDKYEDESRIDLTSTKRIVAHIDYPGNELPITNKFESNSSTQGFHLYDMLPIEFYCKWEDRVKKGDIIVHKLQMPDDSIKAFFLQVVDMVSYGKVDIEKFKYVLSPVSFNLDDTSNAVLKTEVVNYLKEPLIADPIKRIVTPFDDE